MYIFQTLINIELFRYDTEILIYIINVEVK